MHSSVKISVTVGYMFAFYICIFADFLYFLQNAMNSFESRNYNQLLFSLVVERGLKEKSMGVIKVRRIALD